LGPGPEFLPTLCCLRVLWQHWVLRFSRVVSTLLPGYCGRKLWFQLTVEKGAWTFLVSGAPFILLLPFEHLLDLEDLVRNTPFSLKPSFIFIDRAGLSLFCVSVARYLTVCESVVKFNFLKLW
jgi:hypothetical protein